MSTPRALRVGDRFTRTDSRTYRDGDVRGTHTVTTLNEVSEVDEVGFKAVVVEVIEEAGRPSFATGTPSSLSMAWFGWDAAAARGDIRKVG